MNGKKIFLYGELQMTVPFDNVDWQSINAELKKVPGLVRKTWLYGIRGGSVGGFYEFDSEENARNLAELNNPLVCTARRVDVSRRPQAVSWKTGLR